jgi:hypothetical protein
MIKKYKDFNNKKVSEAVTAKAKKTEIFGVDRKPSNVMSREEQDFYDYYTRKKFRGMSKYELNSKVFDLAQKNDDLAVLAQFCLQIERESIAGDDYIAKEIDKGIEDVIPVVTDNTGDAGKDLDDISLDDIDEIKDDIESLKNK